MAMRPAILLLVTTLAGYGQRGTEPPKYEVASIKPNMDNDFRYTFRIEPDGTLAATGITLKRLMMTAYNVQGFRIVGGPGWVDSRRWDVQARPNRAASSDQIRPMLRALLEDRFQLHSHSETRNMPVYELVVDRKGAKIPTAKDTETRPTVRVTTGSIELTKATSATFASQLSYALSQPVIDKTSLSGTFDFAIEWTPEPREDGGPTTAGLPPGTPEPPASTLDGPSIFTAIREQLGLRLQSGRGPVEAVVIDDLQMPTSN
jgi:bla regulator protein blaR1